MSDRVPLSLQPLSVRWEFPFCLLFPNTIGIERGDLFERILLHRAPQQCVGELAKAKMLTYRKRGRYLVKLSPRHTHLGFCQENSCCVVLLPTHPYLPLRESLVSKDRGGGGAGPERSLGGVISEKRMQTRV